MERPRPLYVHGTFRVTEGNWIVRKVTLSGAMGMGPQINDGKVDPSWRKNQARTAYSEDQLAWHTQYAICAQPSFPRASFISLFANVLRFPERIPGDVWLRVRRKAYYLGNGVPDSNLERLPALKAEMEKQGHDLEYETIDGKQMVTCVLSVRKAECDRRRRAVLKVRTDLRTDTHREDLLPWPDQRRQFEDSHGDFLKDIADPSAKYLNYLAFTFGFVKQQFSTLLKFVSFRCLFREVSSRCISSLWRMRRDR